MKKLLSVLVVVCFIGVDTSDAQTMEEKSGTIEQIKVCSDCGMKIAATREEVTYVMVTIALDPSVTTERVAGEKINFVDIKKVKKAKKAKKPNNGNSWGLIKHNMMESIDGREVL